MTSLDDVETAIAAFVAAEWDPELTVGAWWERLAVAGWAAPTWPREWHGQGLGRDEAAHAARTLHRLGALGPPGGLGLLLAGPTILAHGDDDQKARLLWPIVSGQVSWCQLFSEPDAGSDLANVKTRAVRDGEGWRVDGQKVWTSGATTAQLGMLLARTDPTAPKHQGLSYFAIDMTQPGVDVRPLTELTGRALFNEVFLTGCAVADGDRIGPAGAGWAVANTTLANERQGLGGGPSAVGGLVPGPAAGVLDRRAGDFVGRPGRGATALMSGRMTRQLVERLAASGGAVDPVLRQELAQLHTYEEIARYTALRAKAAKEAGRGLGPEVSVGKLSMSRTARLAQHLVFRTLGAEGTLYELGGGPRDELVESALFSAATGIYGGSDQVQRNIIGDRVLGLPREPRVDRDLPFDQLPS